MMHVYNTHITCVCVCVLAVKYRKKGKEEEECLFVCLFLPSRRSLMRTKTTKHRSWAHSLARYIVMHCVVRCKLIQLILHRIASNPIQSNPTKT